ncbi:PQQ-like beta-propeller repeat protein, partial [Candidatus Pacearchaeota archaeon]|nr:PQQ-like beta-propeller repeat protein [Candidatus Pacearchaeota archaeon]
AHVNACEYRDEGQACTSSHWIIIYGYDDTGNTFSINDPGYQYETSVTYDELKLAMKNAYVGNDEVLIIIDTVSIGIGYYSEGSAGWVDDASDKFVAAYKRNGRYHRLGLPCDHEGCGEWVHPYSFTAYGSETTVYLQDVCHGEYGQKTICYLPGAEKACLLEGCLGFLWWEFNDLLGVPTSDEIDDKNMFPSDQGVEDFEIMQTFVYGMMFWDQESGVVRMICNAGTCEEMNITLCIPEGQTPENLDSQSILDSIVRTANSTDCPTCYELRTNLWLNNCPWPMSRHDAQRTARSTNMVASTPEIIWEWTSVDDSRIRSVIIGVDETIYVSSGVYLKSINSNGILKWQYELSQDVGPSAIGSDGTIYFKSGASIYALDSGGNLKWEYKTNDDYDYYKELSRSPAIGSDGTIYFVGKYAIYAIKPDGTLKWRDYVGYSPPNYKSSLAIGHNGILYFTKGNALIANSSDQFLWQTWLTSDVAISSSPAIASDGTIYVTAYNCQGTNHTWLCAIQPDGTKKWQVNIGGYRELDPVIGFNNTVLVKVTGYFGGNTNGSSNGIRAINADGSLKWETYLNSIESRIESIVVDSKGHTYCISNLDYTGSVCCLDDNGT